MRMELTDDNLEEYLNENFKNRFNNLMSLSNTDLRKEIENSNWSFILQELRWADNELDKYKNVIDKIRNKIKEDNEYLENAKEMYSEHDDELVKVATLQLINNNLVQNLELMMILEKAE